MDTDAVTIFLCGDVMTGRGIDQVLPHPSDPVLSEPYVTSAREYVRLAEDANGPIPKPVDFSYIWGDATAEFDRLRPDARIVNLETAVTESEDRIPKGINYRMHPRNVPCLTAARVDCCALANNHVLDWGQVGLLETLETLFGAGLKTAGAGRDLAEAQAPAILDLGAGRRVLVFSFGTETSGIPPDWAAAEGGPGVNLLADLSDRTVDRIVSAVRDAKRSADIVIASIHWGGNWGYPIPDEHRRFAHRLIDAAQVDVVHGHSSHHVKGIEVYRNKAILYGCGDFLTDYEGISGYEAFRDDLVLMYFLSVRPNDGRLVRLEMKPLQIRNFRLRRANLEDTRWMMDVLNREGANLGTGVERDETGNLKLRWV